MPLSRRDFIKIGGATAGVTAIGAPVATGATSTPGPVSDPQTQGDHVVATFCELCFWKCGILAHVKDGQVTKIVGNPEHPLSNGRLCPRGTGGTGLLYDPDRLRQPLVRREKRGDQVFEPVTWDAALDQTAEALLRVREAYGPEALALFNHGCGSSWFQTLVKAYGTENIGAPSYAQCRGSRESAFELTFGAPVGSPEVTDLRNARVITLIGNHLGENMHNTQVQELAAAIERGAELVVVDPRFSVAAGKARYWLPIKPGTDLALLLAWMHVIVSERLYDSEYVENYAIGLDELKAHLADKTPEWAFTWTGIEPQLIEETARFIAGARPASLVHPGRHAAWYGDDTQRERAIAILDALLGAWGRSGGFFIPARYPVPKLPIPPFDHHPRPPADMARGTVYPFAGEVLSHGLRDASIPGFAEYDIKAWMVYGSNLIQALPEPEKTKEALSHLDFVVAIDILPMEITGWADVVLPENTYLERYDDLIGPPWREPYVTLRQPVVEPLYESKPGWWIARELAVRMGLEAWFPWSDIDEYLEKRTAAAGIDLAQLKATGVVRGAPEPITIEEGLVPTFETPSGKIELFSQQMADAGLSPLPEFTPPDEPGPGQFRLLFGRAPVHTFGRTTNNRMLSEIVGDNVVWLNADRAAELGFTDGEPVVLVNQDGVKSQPIKVKATQRIRPDCVYMIHGFGHEAKGLNFARGRGADDSRLVTRVKVDPVMGGTGMNVNFVSIEKVLA